MTRHLVKLAAERITSSPCTLTFSAGRCVIFVSSIGYPGRTWDDALEFLVKSFNTSVESQTETDGQAVS